MNKNSIQVAGLFTIGWLLVAVLSLWATYTSGHDKTVAIISGALFLSSVIYSRFALGLSLTSAPLLYLLVFGVFHLGLLVPWALGIYQPQGMLWFSPGTLSPAVVLITLAILCFGLGLIAAIFPGTPLQHSAPKQSVATPALVSGGLGLFIAGASMFVWALSHLGPNVTYKQIFVIMTEVDPRFLITGLMLAGIGLPIAAAGAAGRQRMIVLGITGIWSLWALILGFRGPALIVAVVVYAVLVKRGLRLPRFVTTAAVGLILLAIPILRLTRNTPDPARSLDTAWREAHMLDSFVEMGGSTLRPLVTTVALMQNGDFFYGKTYLAALRIIVPNISLHWAPPENVPLRDLPPNHWVTAWADPWAFAHGGGIGFTAVAEPYMNFGYPGVVLYFLGLGFLLARLDQCARANPYSLAVWGVFMGALLWTVRNDFTNFFRPVVWGCAFIFLIWLIWERNLSSLFKRQPAIQPAHPAAHKPLRRSPCAP